ncbi:hypothetical protein, partial [uncultured Allofournierella sp.]|uniref:hypothetical protein n=1 Tax=uncultured Allofournierella sp. TaxID=1940258 RepID=UPI00375325FB
HREDLIPLLVPGYKPKAKQEQRPATRAQAKRNQPKIIKGQFVSQDGKKVAGREARPTFAPKKKGKRR